MKYIKICNQSVTQFMQYIQGGSFSCRFFWACILKDTPGVNLHLAMYPGKCF
jgi:hypothetical protein